MLTLSLFCSFFILGKCQEIAENPYCEQKISEVKAMNGSTVFLPCKVRGNPKPTITWMKGTETLTKSGTKFVQGESGLTILGAEVDDTGKYQVTLVNKLKTYNHVISLNVLTSDSVKPENYNAVTEHDAVVIGCGKRPANPGDIIDWIKQGVNVLNFGDKRFSIDTNGSLIIMNTLRSDTGLYECASKRKTADGDITLSVNMFLNVRYAPSINNIKDYVIVYSGRTSALPCSASGNPGVNFRWFYPGGKTNILKSEKFEIATNGSLIIRNADIHDGGNYTCAPYNTIGDGQYGYTDLRVYVPPKFHNDGKDVTTVRVGNEITIDCAADGIPTPNITWQRGLGKKIDEKRVTTSSAGLLTIKSVAGDDSGTYECIVQSDAGKISRTLQLQVIGKPGTPHIQKVTSAGNAAWVTWIPSFNGGSKQIFEFWSLPATQTEFEWNVSLITNCSQGSNEHIFKYADPEKDLNGRAIAYWCSMRAKNDEGYSDFGEVFKVIRAPGLKGQRYSYIQDNPLQPYDFEVNITAAGYNLQWKTMLTPGRPKPEGYRIQYKSENSTAGWETLKKDRLRRSLLLSNDINNNEYTALFINTGDLPGAKHPLEFSISTYSYDGNGKEVFSIDVKPGKVTKSGIPLINTASKAVHKDADSDLIPPVVLGCIFSVFVIVLIISLYCFCRRRKQRRYQASKNEKKMQYNVEHGVDAQREASDATQLLFDLDSPRRFHLRNCPALSLGKYNSHNMANGIKKDDVYVLLEPNEDEKRMCTCNKKYLTLNNHEKPKREKKKGLYKSSSSPSVLLTSDMDASSIDPVELLDEENYDISDVEKDQVVELNLDNQRSPTLNRKGFKDSYDQFCTNDVSRLRLSSNEKTEVDNNKEVPQKLQEVKNASSEQSAMERNRIATPRDHIKDQLSNENFLESNKSSGFGDGSHLASDNESIAQEMMDKPTLLRPNGYSTFSGYVSDTGRRDPGYASDHSTRSSPLEYIHRNKYNPPSQRHNTHFINNNTYLNHDPFTRPPAPPSYNQAIVDIERMSEKNDITDSEEMYGNLIEMERQLGVTLDDSIDSDLNIKTSVPPSRPYSNPKMPFGIDTGYMSDAQYSDREKTARCKQLLNEFKSTRVGDNGSRFSEDDLDDEIPIAPPTLRSRSVMDDVTESRAPLKRSNSVGNSSVYKEWLV